RRVPGPNQRRRVRGRDRTRDQAPCAAARLSLGGDQCRRPLLGEPADDRHEGRDHRPDRTRPQGRGSAQAEVIDVADRYLTYQALPDRAPTETLAWNVYGKGVEAVGRDGRPETVPVPRPSAEQLLVRVDAVGLCFSAVKRIRL